MNTLLKNIAQMQMVLAEMESQIGIRQMSPAEKSILAAIADLAGDTQLVSTKDILDHQLNEPYSRPSMFRALKNLEQLGKISKSGKKRGLYCLVNHNR